MASETYEVWVRRSDGSWGRLPGTDGDGLFHDRKTAMALCGKIAGQETCVEAVLVERRSIMKINGPALIAPKKANTESA
jgi:hypothetical protein